MSSIKNVVVAGGTGALGSVVLERLIASAKFNITLLKRTGSSTATPSGVKVVEADYSSPESLQSALTGQDAVVSTLGTTSILPQLQLIDAAAAAGIKRFLPSEFGCDIQNPKNRALPVYGHKVQVQDHLLEKAKTTSGFTYTLVLNNAFLDWGIEHRFILDVSAYKPLLVDGGETPFSVTYLSTVGDSVVGVLSHPEETKNRAVRIHDLILSQKDLLDLAKEVAPEKPWEPQYAKLDDLTGKSDARLAQGIVDMETMVPYLFRAIMDPSHEPAWKTTDNELLELKTKTKEDIKETLKKFIV